MTTTDNTRPPQKHPAKILNYDSDQLADPSSTTTVHAQPNNSNCTHTANPTQLTNKAFAIELLAIKQEIAQLKTTTATVEQIKTAIALLHDNPSPIVSNAMDTKTEFTTPTNLSAPNTTPYIF